MSLLEIKHNDINELPPHCQMCPMIFDKMGACHHPDTSIIFSYISLIPYFVAIVLIFRCLYTWRTSHFYIAMLLLTAYLTGQKILKNLLKSERPAAACKKSYGLPSSHMTVMLCYAYYIISYYTDWKIRLSMLILCILQGIARVQLHYHTVNQVLLGTAFGLLYAQVFTTIFTWLYKQIRPYLPKLTILTDDYHAPPKMD